MLLPRKLTAPKAATLAGAFFLAAFAALGPAQTQPQPKAQPIELRGAGSTLAAPLYNKWNDAFQRAHPNVALHYDAVGSGEGVKRFLAGAIDFGGSDEPLDLPQKAKVERGVIQTPATAGLIVLAYNLPEAKGELKLPQDVYVDIFLGRIRSWNDPRIKAANPGLSLPAKDIAIIGRQDSSGTTFAFTSHLAAISKTWKEHGPGVGKIVAWPQETMIARGNEGVASRIKISDGSIGYVEYGFARRLDLKVATLENKAGRFVAPTTESGMAAFANTAGEGIDGLEAATFNPPGAEAYPIATYSWLLLYRHYPAGLGDALKSYAFYALDQGQAEALALGYIPLPKPVVELAKAAVEQVDASTAASQH